MLRLLHSLRNYQTVQYVNKENNKWFSFKASHRDTADTHTMAKSIHAVPLFRQRASVSAHMQAHTLLPNKGSCGHIEHVIHILAKKT